MQEAEKKLLEVHMLLGKATSDKIDIDLKIALLKKTKKAIEVMRSCTELKGKEAPSFEDWKKIKMITENNKLFYLNEKRYYYEEIYKIYKEWISIHF